MRRIAVSVVALAASGCGFEAKSASSDAAVLDARFDSATIDAAVDARLPDAPGTCEQTTIAASKSYGPSVWTNGSVPVTSPFLLLTVPPTLAVTMGNAGNHCAELTFKLDDNRQARCRYRGGASTSSPTSGTNNTEIQNGMQYLFDECREGAACPTANGTTIAISGGDEVALAADSTPITLRIDHGDTNVGITTIQQSIQRCEDD